MSKSINAVLLGIILFLVGYSVCFLAADYPFADWAKDGLMPKFYPMLGEVHIIAPPGKNVAVKFVGAAVVGAVLGLAGWVIGRRLPAALLERSGPVLHVVTWVMLAAACFFLVRREAVEYILH